jgi:excisionase family DNA binding protein
MMAWLTPKEAAPRIGLSRNAVYALCAGGEIEHIRVGTGRGVIRIAPQAIEKYLDQAKERAVQPPRTYALKYL